MLIRPEQPADHDRVADIHRRAFGRHGEDVVAPLLVDLRRSLATEQGLSLVACEDDEVVGHVLFTRSLLDAPPRLVEVQVLSPIAVHPDHQRRGVGAALIEHGVAELDDLGVPAVFLEGDPAYYRRRGFVAAGELGFRRPSLRIPDVAFQVRLLRAHEPWMTGTLVYRQTFWDHDAVGLRDS
ncbi:GNAT family N-acetyltransferase [Petropleomorpha daqingensis]|uniref:Putative acetyltransferase n=1 Tax=Petropleomorpha daqingensis TaxID=2026353 RepID=A0A853CBQ7_9ACTN|nr:putative acetyltransferase [Petropleomorpha daqingensis]